MAVLDMHRRHDPGDALGPHTGDPFGDLTGLREYLWATHDMIHGPSTSRSTFEIPVESQHGGSDCVKVILTRQLCHHL